MSKKAMVTSVHQRLKNIARAAGRDFNAIQIQYIQERFLYRLSKSVYKNAFILKGALLFIAYNIPTLRPTKDIDFLGNEVTNDLDGLKEIIKEICSIEYEDAVEFDKDSIEVTAITEEHEYPGARVKLIALIGNARITLWLDFAFGDKIVAGPVEIDFPNLLDFDPPNISVYSLESSMAEKFEACVKLNFDTSRMKDFYDLHELALNNTFQLGKLRDALNETFVTRGTKLADRKLLFGDEFKNNKDKAIQWNSFLSRTGLKSEFTFQEIIGRIEEFIDEACEIIESEKHWNYSNWSWE